MELLDVVDERGMPTGAVVERSRAHAEGIAHRTAHVWVVRRHGGRTQVLLQLRSADKDSYPNRYDTSSAGHIPAGEQPRASAVRELAEELGIFASEEELAFAGTFRIHHEEVFGGRPFIDEEHTWLYVLTRPVDVSALTLQASEVAAVAWFDLVHLASEVRRGSDRVCVTPEALDVLTSFLAQGTLPR